MFTFIVSLAAVASCAPSAAPIGQPVTMSATQQTHEEPKATATGQPASVPCSESATDRAWRAYEEAQNELRWYDAFDGLQFFTGDETLKRWPKELNERRVKAGAEITFSLFGLHSELEKNPNGFDTVTYQTALWESIRERVKEERIAYVEDTFRLVYQSKQRSFMAGIVPLKRPNSHPR
jgi:hypothetical protein